MKLIQSNVDGKYVFEIGGNKNCFKQIKDAANSYLVIDTDITQNKNKIQLWMFEFLYYDLDFIFMLIP